MTTYQIQINERMTLGKNLVALLQSMPRVVTFKKPIEDEEETISKKEILEDLNEAFREVKLMMEGKKKLLMNLLMNYEKNNKMNYEIVPTPNLPSHYLRQRRTGNHFRERNQTPQKNKRFNITPKTFYTMT